MEIYDYIVIISLYLYSNQILDDNEIKNIIELYIPENIHSLNGFMNGVT